MNRRLALDPWPLWNDNGQDLAELEWLWLLAVFLKAGVSGFPILNHFEFLHRDKTMVGVLYSPLDHQAQSAWISELLEASRARKDLQMIFALPSRNSFEFRQAEDGLVYLYVWEGWVLQKNSRMARVSFKEPVRLDFILAEKEHRPISELKFGTGQHLSPFSNMIRDQYAEAVTKAGVSFPRHFIASKATDELELSRGLDSLLKGSKSGRVFVKSLDHVGGGKGQEVLGRDSEPRILE